MANYKKSKSGFYRVQLARSFPYQEFVYKPSHEHTVNDDLLEVMLAEPDLVIGAPQPV